jgi:hypothetical protein
METKNLKPVVAMRDDSGHWYVIPKELQSEFSKLIEMSLNYDDAASEQAELEFTDKFSKYRTGGDLNNVQLYAEL